MISGRFFCFSNRMDWLLMVGLTASSLVLEIENDLKTDSIYAVQFDKGVYHDHQRSIYILK